MQVDPNKTPSYVPRERTDEFTVEHLQLLVEGAPRLSDLIVQFDKRMRLGMTLAKPDDAIDTSDEPVFTQYLRFMSLMIEVAEEEETARLMVTHMPFEWYLPQSFCQGYRRVCHYSIDLAAFAKTLYDHVQPSLRTALRAFVVAIRPHIEDE